MRKRPAYAVARSKDARRHQGGQSGGMKPPGIQESLLDRVFTSIAHITGLKNQARRSLVERIARMEKSAGDQITQHLQYLYQLQNKVVDGGWVGFWTSFRVCLGTV